MMCDMKKHYDLGVQDNNEKHANDLLKRVDVKTLAPINSKKR